jgi:LacI family transcriptional regulator
MPQPAHIAIAAYGSNNPFILGEVLEGLATYARRHARWSFDINPTWRPQRFVGVVSFDTHGREGLAPAALNHLPRVNVLHDRGGPAVLLDDEAMGRLAGEHLLQCGLHDFAYVGLRNEISDRRQHGLQAVLELEDTSPRLAVDELGLEPDANWDQPPWRRRLGSWLAGLERPTGVLAFNDQTAQVIIEEALEAGLDVPNDLAVVGVDNHFMRCEFSLISITSVDRAADQAGFEAGRMLDELLQGRTPDPARVLVAPRGVVTRRSTDMLAVKDPLVARALACIRDRACEGLSVEDLAGVMQVSRSTLEKRFRGAVAHSPHEWIRRRRLGEVRRLLRETDLPLADVAVRCGFASLQYLSAAFRRAEGIPPTQYRKRHQVG